MEDLFYSDGEPLFSEEISEDLAQKETIRQRQLLAWHQDFIDTFTTTGSGRRVLWWLMHSTGYFERFEAQNANAYAYLAKRAIGSDIADVLGPEKILETLIIVKEENKRKEKV